MGWLQAQSRVNQILSAIGCLLFTAGALSGELKTYRLADLNTGNVSLDLLLKQEPSPSTQDEHIKCESLVQTNGGLVRPFCYLPNRERTAFETRVLEALLEVEARPARLNGRRKSVWLQFSVHLSSIDGSIRVMHDNRPPLQQKGDNYKGPQRYFFPRRCDLRVRAPILATYRISRTGDITDIDFEMAGGNTIQTRRASRCLKQTKYFPAELDGVAVESVVLEPIFSTSRIKILRRYY